MTRIRTGIDIVDISRLKKNFDAHVSRWLSAQEKKYVLEKKVVPWVRLAGIFAAKESMIKAIRQSEVSYLEVCVEHDSIGAPYPVLSDRLQKILKQEGMVSMDISISHEKESYAVAICQILFIDK